MLGGVKLEGESNRGRKGGKKRGRDPHKFQMWGYYYLLSTNLVAENKTFIFTIYLHDAQIKPPHQALTETIFFHSLLSLF